MINAKIDDKKCVVTLKGIENNAKNMNRAMRIIALEMEESVRLIGALFEPRENKTGPKLTILSFITVVESTTEATVLFFTAKPREIFKKLAIY